MSDDPNSWPEKWADKDPSWNGFWNGYFGKRTNADQESYFVMDDDVDDRHDFFPDSTDDTRRGLGLKVGVRGFQWSNMLAEDLIFWHYDIYNFARPPEKPKIWAVAGDNRVTLYWDDASEKSYDPFSDPPYDFEGYKIYKSTDPAFLDARIITNAFGEKTFFQPAAQFDIRNNVSDFFPLDYHGMKIYMGDNKGLQHAWTDTAVMNGKTYYYAVVSYDRGDAKLNMYPSECKKVIVRDINGNVKLDRNTVEITPQSPAAGYEQGA